jgi:ATP-dependent helicase/DNAse subunit B
MEAVERTSLYPDDKRRDIVHVMDVYEARQWELPVVFVCGLLEQEFPRYHRQDAVLGDADRVRLQAAGIHLRTTADRQREERFLFDFAASRATELLVLSYPRFRPGGEETLPSFVLERFPGSRETARNAAARPRRSVLLAPPSRLPAGALEPLAARLSPSAVESYLQCPFLYFARHALGIEGAPPAPGDRLDFLARGSIVHRVLAGYTLSPLFLEELFHRAFDAECAQRNAVAGYRTESLRQDLLEDLRRFAASPPLADSATLAVEKTFEYPAGEGVTVRGRVDRVVRVPGGIVVIDYKYSAPAGVRKTAAAAEDGAAVQAGIYLLAMARSFHAAPAGALYCGLKKEVRWEGWHVPLNGWEDIGQTVTRRELEELAARSAGLALEAARGIRAGRVGPEPRDPGKCGRCEFRDICRIEEAAAVRVREAGA